MNNDITFCLNRDCPIKNKCRRGQDPIKSHVSIAMFEYEVLEENKIFCSGYWMIENENTRF